MNLLFFIIGFTVLFILVELLFQKTDLTADITRKFAHMASGAIVFFFPLYLTKGEILFISILFATALSATKLLGFFGSIHKVERSTFGEILFPCGVGLAAILFLPTHVVAFQFGILVLAISDALAGIVGSRYGRHKITFGVHKKSVEGTLSFFVSTLIIILFFGSVFSPSVFIAAGILSLVELFLVFGLDNIILPLVAGYAFLLLT